MNATAFATLFAGRVSSYGQYDERDGAKRVRTITASPLPDDAYARHLAGDGPYLGIIPIREDNTCRFGAIDIDEDGIDLAELEAKVAFNQLPLIVCRSKSGGAHLYLFTADDVPATVIVDTLKKFCDVLHYTKNPNGSPVEIFPKQTKLSALAVGNWINLPYYNATDTNRYAVGPGGKRLTLDEFITRAEGSRVPGEALKKWHNPSFGPFGDGPPCLQTLHLDGFPAGSRNTGLLNVGIFLRAKFKDTWIDELRAYNDKLAEPLEASELQQIITNLERHNYIYTCEQYPLQPLCKRRACKKQLYGIESFISKRRLDALPEITNLVKILTEPPRYRVTVNGMDVTVSSEQLQTASQFKRVMFEQLNFVMPFVKPSDWDKVLADLLVEQRIEAAPTDAGERGLTRMFLYDFLLTRSRADDVGDILRGLPWQDGSVIYFRAIDFLGFLQRRNFKKFDMSELYSMLQNDLGLKHETRVIKGAATQLWSIPAPTAEQTERFTLPRTLQAGY